MAKKAFKAESKRLLDMMINSIYTHKEIFLRELISNASDAMDKLYFKSLTENIGLTRNDFEINLTLDKASRVLTISDNGIGMTKEELENNLGVIAQSGSFKFKNENAEATKDNEDISVIGQFGVGFYSAFMVASKVTVETRAYGSDEAYKWYSEGVDGYTITPCEKDSYGTKITLQIKDTTDEEDYDDFVTEYKIRGIVKKYSDYIRYPIKMMMGHSHRKEGTEDEYETHYELETLNSMIPIWNKNKSEITDEEYNTFYKEKFFDYEDPIAHIHSKTEGTATYNSLMYIPAKAPFDYYSKDYEKGLQLYSNGVLIMDKCGDLLPDYFNFVRGLVDSADLSLNISRELLQHDRQLKIIAKSIERTIKNELTKMLRNDRERYEKFWGAFGLQLKFGVYNNFGQGKEQLQDLLLFYSSFDKKYTTLAEYVSRMKEDQKCIYFASGEDVNKIDKLPQTEMVKDKGYEILYLTDSIDEFVMQMMVDYSEKPFKSVAAGDLDLESPEEKEEMKSKLEESKDMISCIKDALGDKVKDVRLSKILKSHAVCLTTDGILSLEMEKVLSNMPNDQGAKAEKVLELNGDHPIFATLKKLYETDKDKLAIYADVLYNQALLIEGMTIEDPVDYSNKLCELLTL